MRNNEDKETYMRNCGRLGIQCLILVLGLAGTSSAEIPELIETGHKHRSNPIWVSETYAIENGEMAWGLFDAEVQEDMVMLLRDNEEIRLEHALAKNTTIDQVDECLVAMIGKDHVFRGAGGTVARLMGSSSHVISGEVIDLKQGFWNGRPGTVYELSGQEVIKAPDDFVGPETYLVFMDVARIKVGSGTLCSMSSRRDAPPGKGSRFVVFLPPESWIEDSAIIVPANNGIFYENADGVLSAPRFEFSELQSRNLNSIIERAKGLRRMELGLFVLLP